jgi:hypothetical protein
MNDSLSKEVEIRDLRSSYSPNFRLNGAQWASFNFFYGKVLVIPKLFRIFVPNK